MLRLAGCSSGRRDCARGVGLRERGGSHAGLCSSCAGRAILSECRVFVRAHHAFLSECRVFVCAHHAFLSECPAFDHACCLPHGAKQNGVRNVAFLFRRGSRLPVVRSRIVGAVIEDGWITLGWCVSLWRARRRTKGTGERGERSRRRGVGAFLRERIGFAMFSAGSTLGQKVEAALRPRPRLRQRVFDSLDSLHLIRGVGAFYAGRGTRVQRRLDRRQ